MNNIQVVAPQEVKIFIGQDRKKNTETTKRENEHIMAKAIYKKNEDVQSQKLQKKVDNLVNELKKYNSQLDYFDKEIKLSINEDIDRVIVTVINKNTNEVIYEYPYRELQQLARHIKEMTGVMFDASI